MEAVDGGAMAYKNNGINNNYRFNGRTQNMGGNPNTGISRVSC